MTRAGSIARPRRRRLRLALTALVVLGAGWAALAFGLGAVEGAMGEPAATVAVERGDLVLGVPVEGTLEAVESAHLGPPQVPGMWNYKIAFMAPEGRQVRAGTPVLGFDASELEQRLRGKVAERDSAEQEIEKKRGDLDRQQREVELSLAEARADLRRERLEADVPPELSSKLDDRRQRIDLAVAEERVVHLEEKLAFLEERMTAELGALVEKRNRAAGRVAELERQIGSLRVTAPRGGTVIYVTDRRNEKKKVGDQVWQMASVIEIPDLGTLRGEGMIDEADAARIELGQPVTLRLDAHPEIEYRGEISKIGSSVGTKPRSPLKVVEVEVALEATDAERMRPGMRFRGTVEIERARDVLLVPAEAVHTTAEGPVVYRQGLWGSEPVRPEVGRSNGESVEIVSGLGPGDRLLVEAPEAG